MRLFVDVDDTLVLWQGLDGESYMDSWTPNEALIKAVIEYFYSTPDVYLYVWSGGGGTYAEVFAVRTLGDTVPYIALSKDTTMPQDDDVCIDDQFLKVKRRCVTWERWCSEEQSTGDNS